jgi:ribosomal protein L37AE/L43A
VYSFSNIAKLPKDKPLVRSAFLFQHLKIRKQMKMNKRNDVQSYCCNSSVIITGKEIYKCIKCGSQCAIGVDYECMSYMLKSIS